MRIGIASALVFLCATSLFADQKSDILDSLANTSSAFAKPGALSKEDAKAWVDAVAGVVVLVPPKSDKTLEKGYSDLVQANKVLVNTFNVLLPQCINLDKFGVAETGAMKAQQALKKATFILPGKRATREVLVKLADYIVGAAKIGISRGRICTNLATMTLLSDVKTKLGEVEAARKGVHKNINETQLAQMNFEKVEKEFAELSKAEKTYVQSTKETINSLKTKKSLNKKETEDLEAELVNIETAAKEVDGFLLESKEAKEKRAEAAPIKERIAQLNRQLETLASSKKKIEATLKGKVESFKSEREEAGKAVNNAFQACVAAIKRTLESGEEAGSVLDEYKKVEGQAKKVCGITQVTARTIESCRVKAIDHIKKAALGAKLTKQCGSLEKESGQRDIDMCATAAGKV